MLTCVKVEREFYPKVTGMSMKGAGLSEAGPFGFTKGAPRMFVALWAKYRGFSDPSATADSGRNDVFWVRVGFRNDALGGNFGMGGVRRLWWPAVD